MTPCRGTIFSSVPPSNSLVAVWTLEGLFELTRRLSRVRDGDEGVAGRNGRE